MNNAPTPPKRKIGRPPHKYSKYFVILDEKANRIERFAMCKACILNGSTQTKIINRKRNCRSHLRKCQFQTEDIQLTDNEPSDDDSSRKSLSKSAKLLPVGSSPAPTIDDDQKRNLIPLETGSAGVATGGSASKKVKTAIVNSDPLSPILHQHHHQYHHQHHHQHQHQHQQHSDQWVCEFEQNLLRFTLANELPFRWIENPESIKFLHFLDPSLKTRRRVIPSKRSLSHRILEEAASNLEEKQKDVALDKRGITLIFDGWKNVRNESIMGLVLINSRGSVVIWDSRDISAGIARTEDVILKVEEMLGDERLSSVNIIGVVMDSSIAYCGARHQLRRKYWRISWIPCFAHQVNLCIGDVFCVFKNLHPVMIKAIRIVEYFNKSIFLLEKLKIKQAELCGKHFVLTPPSQSNMKSYHTCLTTLLSCKAAIQGVALDGEVITFSDSIFQLNQTMLPIHLEEEIAASIMDNVFWSQLGILCEVLNPFIAAFNQLQTSYMRLHHVIHHFGLFVQLFTGQSPASQVISQLDVTERASFLNRLEKRWKEWEHPLLILAYFLHPKYRNVNFSTESRISTSTLGEWALKYYHIWFHQQPKQLLAEMQKYQGQMEYPFTPQVSQQFYNADVLDYWNFVSPVVPELGCFAIRLLSITVTSGSCEHHFSDISFIQNKRRRRLDHKKILSINQIRSDITNYHKENAKNLASLKKAMDSMAGKGDIIGNELAVLDSDVKEASDGDAGVDTDDDLQSVANVEEWQRVINDWIKLLEEENIGVDALLDAAGQKSDFIHPADDPQGKWPLEKLFGVALEPPV